MGETSAERPWGSWHVLDEGLGFKVKRIEVLPHHRLSLQTHAQRSEHWTVVRGTATCLVDGEEIVVPVGRRASTSPSVRSTASATSTTSTSS